jgi:hypothetical protein
MTATTNAASRSGLRCIKWVAVALLSALLQLNKVFVNGRLLRWPPFAKGSLSASGTGFAALLACEGYYRALGGRRHNSWRSASQARFRETAVTTTTRAPPDPNNPKRHLEGLGVAAISAGFGGDHQAVGGRPQGAPRRTRVIGVACSRDIGGDRSELQFPP